jgi:UDP:flavonoid glycosyltransferase YjiC (YdhE family)
MVDTGEKIHYGTFTDDDRNIDKYKRELGRLKSSPSFRLSELFSQLAHKPWRLLWLPFSICSLLIKIIREKVGQKPRFSVSEDYSEDKTHRNCVVLFPTNGVGFGHFTRMLAVARKLRLLDPDLEIVFFTTMPTLQILKEEGFPAYHLPNRKKFNQMEPSTWNAISEDMLANVFTIHKPKVFVFDGTYPYRGMLNAIKRREDITRIWMRRPTAKKKSSSIPVDSLDHFDLIFKPEDSIESVIRESEKKIPFHRCNPILLVEKEEMLDKMVLRNRLGIPKDAIVAYVQLGAGRINDIQSDISITLDAINKSGAWAVIGESMLGQRIFLDGKNNIRILRDFPNSKYFNSFDFAIIAGGYNSYHEAISFSLPSICIPNVETGMDDQIERAKFAEEKGCMIVIEDVSKANMKKAIAQLMDENVRTKMKVISSQLKKPNGALEVAEKLCEIMNEDS